MSEEDVPGLYSVPYIVHELTLTRSYEREGEICGAVCFGHFCAAYVRYQSIKGAGRQKQLSLVIR